MSEKEAKYNIINVDINTGESRIIAGPFELAVASRLFENVREQNPGELAARPYQVIALSPAPTPKQRFFLVETWQEQREIFKQLIGHTFIFTAFIGALTLLEFIFKHADLPPEYKEALGKIDFYMVVASLVIFAVSFIIKLIVFEYRKFKE